MSGQGMFVSGEGYKVGREGGCFSVDRDDGLVAMIPFPFGQALAEFLQAEQAGQDECGRWRDPKFPHFVCYPKGADGVVVLDERDGTVMGVQWDVREGRLGKWVHRLPGKETLSEHRVVADRYFKVTLGVGGPLNIMKPGEVWDLVLQDDESEETAVVRCLTQKSECGVRFIPVLPANSDSDCSVGVDPELIVDARRIIPLESSCC